MGVRQRNGEGQIACCSSKSEEILNQDGVEKFECESSCCDIETSNSGM